MTTNKLVILLFFPTFLMGQIDDRTYLPKGKNKISTHCHDHFCVGYSEEHEQAAWVAYFLTRPEISGSVERTDDFRSDEAVLTGTATLSDYRGSGMDRGHLKPAADAKLDQEAMSETFYFCNMSPQYPNFNRNEWRFLEQQVRYWVKERDSLYVVTGPVFENSRGEIGTNEVTIPGYYYKIIYDVSEKDLIAFLMPHWEENIIPYEARVRSVDLIEKMTGLDFFPGLDKDLEKRLEGKEDTEGWSMGVKKDHRYEAKDQESPSHKNTGGSAVQCLGTAKTTGQRCRNKTKNTNGYCHYHQSQAK
jgi:endonuclease G